MSEISSEKFELVKSYLADLELTVVAEDAAEELVVVEDEEAVVPSYRAMIATLVSLLTIS